tara:strand:+ start:304 stop:531 length:228 start_codon:yes stop_codon:yes gene_type:complete
MGWWAIDGQDGGLSWRNKSGTQLYNGDAVADELGNAVDALVKIYESKWERKPYKEELRAALNFVLGGMEDLEEHP